MAKRLLATLAAVVLTACSSSTPTVPGPVTPAAASYEGVWAITYTVAECGGFRQCVHWRGESRTVHLQVTPGADGYAGVLQLEPHLHVSLAGSIGADGRLTLKGIRRAALSDDYETDVEALTLPVAGSPSTAPGGSIRFATRGPNNSWLFGSALTSGPITVAERTEPLSSSSFNGKWTGSFPGNNCVATGWTHCFPFWDDTTYPLTLQLVQSGGAVSGTVSMSGSAIPVSGTASPPQSGTTMTHRLETDGLQMDKLGRITGTLRLVTTWEWKDGRGTWVVSYPAIPLHSVARSFR
jgi:hypothetical protein